MSDAAGSEPLTAADYDAARRIVGEALTLLSEPARGNAFAAFSIVRREIGAGHNEIQTLRSKLSWVNAAGTLVWHEASIGNGQVSFVALEALSDALAAAREVLALTEREEQT